LDEFAVVEASHVRDIKPDEGIVFDGPGSRYEITSRVKALYF
jgi:hypothetical protein